MPQASKQADPALKSGILKRALGNAGLLLTGKGASGVMQLATFALAARTLGPVEFGLFSVMLAQIQLLIVLATFQSNQAIVRYGVDHVASGDRKAFQGLIGFTSLLDLAAAAAASLAAFLLAPLVARAAGWDGDYVGAARLLALLPLAGAIATPKGMLRLFGRFDLLARHVTITPAVRLAGTLVLAIIGGSLADFAILWLLAGAVGAAVALLFGWREAGRKGLLADYRPRLRGATRRNPGLWGFVLLSNLHSSFLLLPGHAATILTGLILGAPAAGLMKVAQEIGTALAKPIDLINQAVYPDIARLASAGSWARLRKLIARAGVTAAAIGLAIAAVIAVAGGPLIALAFGDAFRPAASVLLLVSIATAITVGLFAAEPTLYALGRPSRPLLTSLGTSLLFLAVLALGLPEAGLIAAGWAYVAGALASVALSLFWLHRELPRG